MNESLSCRQGARTGQLLLWWWFVLVIVVRGGARGYPGWARAVCVPPECGSSPPTNSHTTSPHLWWTANVMSLPKIWWPHLHGAEPSQVHGLAVSRCKSGNLCLALGSSSPWMMAFHVGKLSHSLYVMKNSMVFVSWASICSDHSIHVENGEGKSCSQVHYSQAFFLSQLPGCFCAVQLLLSERTD